MTSHLAQVMIALPALSALAALATGRRNALAYTLTSLATVAALVAGGLLVWQFIDGDVVQSVRTTGGLPLGPSLDVPLDLHLTATGALIAAVASFVSFVVQMFARWYLFYDPWYRTFTATVALFTSAMLLVVLSGDVLLTLVGWELMGWCSYLLIGHESNLPASRRAAFKAFLVTRVGDAPFVIALSLMAATTRTTRITDIVADWSQPFHLHLRVVAALALVIGVLAKSAQFPFTDWLPDAMEGPTPASALIHAATMVAAGTVVLAQFLPVLQAVPTARLVLVLVAGLTSVFACFAAFCQPDVKRLLAWSTISQVGLMLLALGSLEPGHSADAALLHLVGHAFFKSLLFLLIGWFSVVVGATLVGRMDGVARRVRGTFWLVALGLVSMAGLPPAVAFISKDAMLDDAARGATAGSSIATLALVMLTLVIVGTAAYSARAWSVLQHQTAPLRPVDEELETPGGDEEDVDIVELFLTSPEVDEYGETLEETPQDEDEVLPRPSVTVRVGLWALAVGAVCGGLLVLTPVFGAHLRELNLPLAGASLLLVLATAVLVRLMSVQQPYGDAARRLPQRVALVAASGFGMDRAYRTAVARPVLGLARFVSRGDALLDRGVGTLADASARAGSGLDRLHTRRPSSGLLWVVVGVVLASVLGVISW